MSRVVRVEQKTGSSLLLPGPRSDGTGQEAKGGSLSRRNLKGFWTRTEVLQGPNLSWTLKEIGYWGDKESPVVTYPSTTLTDVIYQERGDIIVHKHTRAYMCQREIDLNVSLRYVTTTKGTNWVPLLRLPYLKSDSPPLIYRIIR